MQQLAKGATHQVETACTCATFLCYFCVQLHLYMYGPDLASALVQAKQHVKRSDSWGAQCQGSESMVTQGSPVCLHAVP